MERKQVKIGLVELNDMMAELVMGRLEEALGSNEIDAEITRFDGAAETLKELYGSGLPELMILGGIEALFTRAELAGLITSKEKNAGIVHYDYSLEEAEPDVINLQNPENLPRIVESLIGLINKYS